MNIVGWFRFYRNAKGIWAYLHDETVSKWHKRGVIAMIVFTAIYVISPLDLIPDVLAFAVTFVAFLDDIGFMAVCFMVLNTIGMRYSERQLPAAPSQEQLPPPTVPKMPYQHIPPEDPQFYFNDSILK